MVIEQPWQAGLIDAARQRNANLVIFAGGALEDPNRFDTQRSRIFELAGPENVDGLIIGSDFLGHYVGTERIKEFCTQYHPLPIVKYEPYVEGYPTLLFDFYQGMYDLVTHLVEVHGLRKIGYITGPQTSRSIADRLHAYQDALAAHGIAYDDRLVVSGSHALPTGSDAVRVLLDERGLRPAVDLEAIVGFYDLIAAGALQALQARGIAVPGEIAIAGFDDDDVAFASDPRLTTVRLPFYEMGRWGVDTLADILDGTVEGCESAPVTTLPAALIPRQSCGCQEADLGTSLVRETPVDGPGGAGREAVLARMLAAAGAGSLRSFRVDLERLLDVFLAHCSRPPEQAARHEFRKELDTVFDSLHGLPYNVEMAHGVLAAAEEELCLRARDEQSRRHVRDLMQLARSAAGDMIERFLVREKQQAAHVNGLLHDLNQALATALSVADLVEVLARHLPRLGVPSCYLSLYDNPQEIGGLATLVLAYAGHKRCELPAQGQRFDAKQLVPNDFPLAAEPSVLVVLPLFHRHEQMGMAMMEVGPRYGGLYEAMRDQISGALKRIQLHDRVVEARRLAEEANALKTRFLSTVTHELRTPLSMIVNLSATLLAGDENADAEALAQRKDDLQLIHSIGQHLDHLVLDVLDLGRSQLGQLRLEMKPLDLHDLLRDVMAAGEQMAHARDLSWRAHVPPYLPPVLADRARLQQILLNLIGNATKFTLHGEVVLLVAARDQEILFSVSDTGLGIPQQDQAIIFDEFRQSERTSARGYGGMGLGLAITRRLVELHGGTIGLMSTGEEGHGATFYFTLPIAGKKAPGEQAVGAVQGAEVVAQVMEEHGLLSVSPRLPPPTILLVDDELDVLRVQTQLIRRRLPYVRVFEASNGRQALDLMQRVLPDLLLLDLMMPELDGFGVLQAMQAQLSLRTIPVIVMTAQVLPEETVIRLNGSVAGVVSKGLFHADETLLQIEAILRGDKRLGGGAQRIARQSLAYIHAHYPEPITRGDLARHAGVNERYLTRCFRQEVGITPIDYLNRCRVDAAKGMLSRGGKSIGEIAEATGFASSSQFSRVFHQYAGMSPREYLRAQRPA